MGGQEIISRIGYFRTKAKLSQKALSIDIAMNIGYINRLESKKDFLPSVEVLLKIIEACGITEEEFFYSDIQNYEEDKLILCKLKELPLDKREALLKLL
ncbi:MAG: helix-turn-helix transcriptional regulator [Clostridia bacterium]|nr:helix-turn-helix transcriptional regulator [Clostridia bacterium]